MNIKNNVNYFTKTDTLKYVGIGMAALGFFLYWFGWGWISYLIICTFIPAGAVLFVVGSSGRANDSDLDELIEVKMRELDPNLDLDKDYKGRIMKHSETVEISGYEYGDGIMVAKMKNGTVRSSKFTKTVIYTLSDALHLTSRSVSLITDDECQTNTYEIPFEKIEKTELFEETKSIVFNKNSFRVKIVRFVIVMSDGSELSFPIHDDMSSETLVENTNRIITKFKSSQE